MKQYIGTKIIKARPMNGKDYNDYRGWDLPQDEDGSDEGYLVEYMNGSDSNHPLHEGYISWSPKKQFEEAYHIAETFKDRLHIELDELQDKLNKLSDFLADPEKPFITSEEVGRLQEQEVVMKKYANILNERIAQL